MIDKGSRLQEEKISDMARLANEMFPEIKELDFKGAVRLTIKVCMEAYHLKQWKDVVKKPPFYRRTFFECILSEAVPQWETSLWFFFLFDSAFLTFTFRKIIENDYRTRSLK